jgi:quercetin dioxygenase-like cupin family protein
MADGYVLKPASAPQVEMWPGVFRRTMGTTDEAMLCEFFLLRGSHVASHNHMNDQVGYVVRGSMDFTIGGVVYRLEAGDSYAIPGGIFHSVDVLQDSIVIDTFSPPRDDYRTEAR